MEDDVVSIFGRLICPSPCFQPRVYASWSLQLRLCPECPQPAEHLPRLSCRQLRLKCPNLDSAFQPLNLLLLQGFLFRKCHLLPWVAQFRSLGVHLASAFFQPPFTQLQMPRGFPLHSDPTTTLLALHLGLHLTPVLCQQRPNGPQPSFLPLWQLVLYTAAREIFPMLS